jgi:hypothetical protein
MTAGVRSQESGVRPGADWRPAFFLFVLAALLVLPIAHGCHGDDVDDEPQAAPPTAEAKPVPR